MFVKKTAVAKASLAACALGWTLASSAAPVASVTLDGVQFLQTGTVLNAPGSGVNIVEISYSLGTPEIGIATFDSSASALTTTPATVVGAMSGFLSNPRWFQTVTWSGLSLAPGASLGFGALDIDLISGLAPLSVNESMIDNVGSSLANGTFSVRWSNGDTARIELFESGWSVTQSFQATGIPSGSVGEGGGQTLVPAPGTLALFGLGLVLLGVGTSRGRTKR